jgi:amidophosphoribosyltransferase
MNYSAIFINEHPRCGLMCGIIGVISREHRDDLGALIGGGLHQIQNRGDFSAGIATIRRLPMSRKEYRRLRRLAIEHTISDFNSMHIEKGHGKVEDVFNGKLDRLTGFMGIGQVRYPTAGYTISSEQKALSDEEQEELIRASIQPLHTMHHAPIAMVHNGDVHNFSELMEYFKHQGLRQATQNDLEVILKVFAEEFLDLPEDITDSERIAMSIKKVYSRVKGTYSVLVLINNVGLVAFRDPEGRRPLFFGVNRSGEGITDYAFASETVALEKMLFKGTKDSRYLSGDAAYDEVKPGEMMFVDKDFNMSRKQIVEAEQKFCPFEASYFMRAPSFLNDRRVKAIREELLNLMWLRFQKEDSKTYSRLLNDAKNTLICPVPRTAESAAQELANHLRQHGFLYKTAIEKSPFAARIFMQPTQKHREKGTIADHYIYREYVEGKNIILIDDSIVRGTTTKHDVKYLRDLGAKEIHIFITFPEIRNPCMHAVDFHTPEEIFANGKTLSQMKKELGLLEHESLVYAKPSEMSRAIGLPESKLCDECYKVS